ncbi:gluconate 5-dehydrogenase [Advenella kashmirensis W13003]|uniref:Gluconate 5-dehydrogenase n=1 Tax=Advenella kashmirensis W13003 TaxID=1424334 RepID=V8QUW6_9BURK|nr:SDR family oxidoreductase [Advenella kashmirensis]ETF03736.1 gluconate 5-dehydrogenase [Advenella kashmirensis W13003]
MQATETEKSITAPGHPLFDLHDQVALVTGATRGLGLEIGRGLGQAGAMVIVHGRDQNSAAAASEKLLSEGLNASWVAFELNDRAACQRAFDKIRDTHARLDILVNNASMRLRKPLGDIDTIELDTIIRTNVLANIEISRAAIALMKLNRYGRIITISSIAGHIVRSGDFIYPITKQALNTMTRSLAVEFGKEGILSNAIAPGTFATEFNQSLIRNPDNIAKMQERNPLQRWGSPAEIIGPVLFLASEAASYVNGQVLTVDGGFSISF